MSALGQKRTSTSGSSTQPLYRGEPDGRSLELLRSTTLNLIRSLRGPFQGRLLLIVDRADLRSNHESIDADAALVRPAGERHG